MPKFNFVLLYVDDVARSETFYAKLLARASLESSPTFCMFPLADGAENPRGGVFLGLWKRNTVAPAASVAAGGSEIAFTAPSSDEVKRLHDEWRAKGIAILHAPTVMDFGMTFTAADPDGHRIRVFAPQVAQ